MSDILENQWMRAMVKATGWENDPCSSFLYVQRGKTAFVEAGEQDLAVIGK